MKVAVLFGGVSTEHNVSIVSGTSVIANLNKEKYDIYPIYIGSDGTFYNYTKNINEIRMLKLNEKLNELVKIDNIVDYLKTMDVIFPVLHGKNGEDGTMQGLFELIGIPYVGCHVLSSSICMDKAYTKVVLREANINQSKSMYIKKYQNKYIYINETFDRQYLNEDELISIVDNYIHFPVFIKPSNSGSSVGVNKSTREDFIKNLEEAFKYDAKVLIEEEIIGRELETAVLGNEDVLVSNIGEIISAEGFYTFDSKYNNPESRTVIPAELDKNIVEEIRTIAKKAYLACDCKGLSRVDFFLERSTNKVILNEINTIPGFTSISMYPKLMESYGISYSELLDRLISLALESKN